MKAKLPSGTQAEKVEFARNLRRQYELTRPHIRMSRTKRRLAVAALLTFMVAEISWFGVLAAGVVSGNKAIAILDFFAGAQATCFVVLAISVGGLTMTRSGLDERERALRDHATATAYRILMVIVAAVGVGAIIANLAFDWFPTLRPDLPLSTYLVPVIWLVGSLPMAVLAWTLPDPEPIDDHR